MKTYLEHVAINTNDYDETLAFYRDLLGFPIREEVFLEDKGTRRAYLDAGRGMIEILAYDEPCQPAVDGVAHVGIRHLAIVVDSVGEAYEELRKAGIDFTRKPEPGAGIVRKKAMFLDPNGIEIELIEH